MQLSALSETAEESSPTPIPSTAPQQPKPPEDQPKPYQPVERPESELHKKLAAQKPDFGDEDPLSQAWNRGEIGIDEYVRHSVERLAGPDNVPAKYRAKEGVPHEAGLALHYALSLAERQASPETKAWLAEMFKQPDPAPARSAPTLPSTSAAAPWTECGAGHTFLDSTFYCRHTVTTTTRFDVYYNIDGIGGPDGVQATDTNANGVPDAVETMTTNLTKAWEQYRAWGYGLTGQSVVTYVGFDFFGFNPNHPGVTIPTGGPSSNGPVILLPPDPGDPSSGSSTRRDWKYTYLPYHEMFHAVQYHHLSNLELGANLTSINWWMEATAEWATHELYKKLNPSGPGNGAYASSLPLFLGEPTEALNTAQEVWSPSSKRQYGAFILANYLTERTTFDFVRQTWQVMSGKLPLEAIEQVLNGYGRNLKTELQGFAVANYRLTNKTTNLSGFLGAADGYADPDASTTWRNFLPGSLASRPKRSAERSLSWGGSTNGLVLIHPGGTSYVELTPPTSGSGRVTVRVNVQDNIPYGDVRPLLVVWPKSSGAPTMSPSRWVRTDAGGSASLSISSTEIATLIMPRVDTYADSGNAQSGTAAQQVTWSASMSTETGVQVNSTLTNMFKNYGDNAGCADWSGGDATQSVRLPSGKRAWFFSDTFLNHPSKRPGGFETSFLRNSIVIQNGSALRTITGGNTCKETDQSVDFWSRYAHTPVGNGSQYWTGDAKVNGDRVVKFYYRGLGGVDTRGAYAIFPNSELDNNTVIRKTPTALADCFVSAPDPIIWGTALVEQGGYTYIYGHESKTALGKRIFLARVPATLDLTDQSLWRYFTGTDSSGNPQWGTSCSASRPLGVLAEAGFSVIDLNNRFWLVHHADPHVTPGQIVANPSTTPWGFTNNRIKLYDPPERHVSPNFSMVYEARVHEGLSSDPSKIVISYNVNTNAVNIGCRPLTDYNADTYRPKFIDVPVTAFFSPTSFKAAAPAMAEPGSAPADSTGGRGIHPPAFTDTGRPPNAPAPPPDGKIPRTSAQEAAKTLAAVAAAPDNSWYDNTVEPQKSNAGCPRIQDLQGSGLTAAVQPLANAKLNWDDVGMGVWYWIYQRDATAGQSWKKFDIWTTKPNADLAPLDGAANHGHRFEWYVVPYASGSHPELAATKSNTASGVIKLAKPAAPTGVTATPAGPYKLNVAWNGVTFPSSAVYYYIYYWTGSQTPVRLGPWGADQRSAPMYPLPGGQYYCFQVAAENLSGEGNKSNPTCATVQ
ncbi:hypothetical protein [Streptosporangium sp. NPDC002524]|uniref:hypothetical protein n=1 Tax=Streptosporangium sp. NPDC002524 TaxID=3154537 RepID=UPI0033246D09